MLSLILDPTLKYPDGDEYYSPNEHFPEYQHAHIATRENRVYRAVRDCFVQSGLDNQNLGTPAWNPLRQFIPRGSRVFVLCNFANERRGDETVENYRSRCTHGSVIRAVVDYILLAVGNEGKVQIGNAPTQFCHWDQVLEDTGAIEALKFYKDKGIPVEARDLRLFVTDATRFGLVRGVERRDESNGVHINLGADSLFAKMNQGEGQRYRVMNYDPRRTESFHSGGKHTFVVNQHILDSDVIFSIPKLKTHEKVGISCALKGYVGIVGHKDSLPHHRYGPPELGGDEYPPDRLGIHRLLTAYHERVQKTKPDTLVGSSLRASFRVLKFAARPFGQIIEGAWYGNDTAWRMVLDLNRIATYAAADGTMQSKPCRSHLALIDGICGGEGEGPAYSTAVDSGVLLFGDDMPMVDRLNALLMGFDPGKIHLIREAFCLDKYPLTKRSLPDNTVVVNGEPVPIENIQKTPPYNFEPSEGWKGNIELA